MSNTRNNKTRKYAPKRKLQRGEALTRVVSGVSLTNYPAIIEGFIAKGIPADDILPRENVFTFNAWKDLGYSVKKGEHGVKVLTYVEAKTEDPNKQPGEMSSAEKAFKFPRTTTVFHLSQVEKTEERERKRLAEQQQKQESAA